MAGVKLMMPSVGLIPVFVGWAACAAGPRVVWVEGENYKTAPQGLERTVGDKASASGGKVLYGECLQKKGNVVTSEFQLPADIPDARVIFRFARAHFRSTMRPAAIELAVDAGAGAGTEVRKEIAFPDTKGWGYIPQDYRLLTVSLGGLKRGKHTLKLTSLADDNDITVDGFFVAPEEFQITDEELNRCCRIQITSEGYVGLARPTTALRQDVEQGISLAVRSFAGKTTRELSWTLAPTGFAALEKAANETPLLKPARFHEMDDGPYTLAISCKDPNVKIEFKLFLCGNLLSKLPDRLAALRAFTADLEQKRDDAKAAIALPDLQHIVQYLEVNCVKFGGEARDENAVKRNLAVLEGLQDHDALLADMRRASDQAVTMMKNLQAGKDACEGLGGDLRRAYRSAGDGNLIPYRVLVPDAYAKAGKVPLILMLHGGGGDEDYWVKIEGGKMLRILNERGYLAVMPWWRPSGRPPGDLVQLLQLTMKQYPKADPNRLYCTGLSMGGFGTYSLVSEHPELFAAACCVSGTGDPARAEKFRNVPLLIFQGGGDRVVDPSGAERVAARMKELGMLVDLRINPKYGHDYHAEEYLNQTLNFFDKHTRLPSVEGPASAEKPSPR